MRPGEGDDPVVRLLADADRGEVELRRARLERALSDFDAATIATTHGFCQEVLSGLGLQGDMEAGATVVEDISDLLAEVVDDLYVRRFHRHGQPQFPRAEALAIARIAVENPAAPIEPQEAGRGDGRGDARAARGGRAQGARAAQAAARDPHLRRPADAAGGRAHRAGRRRRTRRRLRERYRVVLVDEFQDTDPVQWAIMRAAFGGGTRRSC